MVRFASIFTTLLVATGFAIAKPTPKLAKQPVVTYLGTQSPILCESISSIPKDGILIET